MWWGTDRRKFRCDLERSRVFAREVIAAGAKASAGEQASGAKDSGGYGVFRRTRRRLRLFATGILWVRDVATGKETQLTTDGVKDFGYATDNAGWTDER